MGGYYFEVEPCNENDKWRSYRFKIVEVGQSIDNRVLLELQNGLAVILDYNHQDEENFVSLTAEEHMGVWEQNYPRSLEILIQVNKSTKELSAIIYHQGAALHSKEFFNDCRKDLKVYIVEREEVEAWKKISASTLMMITK